MNWNRLTQVGVKHVSVRFFKINLAEDGRILPDTLLLYRQCQPFS
jgi:hypothetical protein